MKEIEPQAEQAVRTPSWLDRWFDAMNPVLLKELRQGRRSGWLLLSFLLAAITTAGVAAHGGAQFSRAESYRPPSVRFRDPVRERVQRSAEDWQRRTIVAGAWGGFLTILAAAAVVAVPTSAFRSMADELDVGTLELLQLTSLPPGRIVGGKLLAAALQIGLHAALAGIAGVAFQIAAPGVELSLAGASHFVRTAGALAAIGLAASAVAVALAVGAPSRGWRAASFMVLLGVLLSLFGFIFWSGRLTPASSSDWPYYPESLLWIGAAEVGAVAASYFFVACASAAAGLAPRTVDRSTLVRTAAAVQIATFGLCAALEHRLNLAVRDMLYSPGPFAYFPLVVALHLGFYGAAFAGESSTLSHRVRRELPTSIFGRLCFRWLRPGSATGLVFCVVLMQGAAVWTAVAPRLLDDWAGGARARYSQYDLTSVIACGYLTAFLGVGRLLNRAFDRGRGTPRFAPWAVFGGLFLGGGAAAYFLKRIHGLGWLALSLNPVVEILPGPGRYGISEMDVPLAAALLLVAAILTLLVSWKGIVAEIRQQAEPAAVRPQAEPPPDSPARLLEGGVAAVGAAGRDAPP